MKIRPSPLREVENSPPRFRNEYKIRDTILLRWSCKEEKWTENWKFCWGDTHDKFSDKIRLFLMA